MRTSNEMQTGKAGEYIVCADLIIKGFVAYLSEQGLPYDVVLDNGNKLFRIQVKTTEKPREIPQRNKKTFAYIFNIKRNGSGGQTKYGDNEIDLFALVCLDTMTVGYLIPSEVPDTVNFRVDKLRGSYYDEKGYADYLECIELKDKPQKDIAEHLGIHISQVSRYLAKGFKPHLTNAKYFSEIIRDASWFKCLN